MRRPPVLRAREIQIEWSRNHALIHGAQQPAPFVSSLFMLLGLLAVARRSRFLAPVVTAIATLLRLRE